GNFPVSGTQMTLVNVSNLATLTFTAVNPGASSTINAGQKNNLIGQFTLLAGNNPVKVTSARFTMTGSEPTQDIQNIYLMNGSAQVGAKLSSLNGNVAQFDLSAAPLMLAAGQTATLSLYADVTGGVGDYFEFTVQQASDIQAVDNMYNVGIGAQLTGGGAFSAQNLAYINVAAGGLVVTAAPQSSMYVVTNNTNAVLGQFSVLASGDSIRLQTLSIALSNAADTNVSVLINGTQLGTTQTAIATSASTTISSNLNYIIPANTTQTLTIQGTVASGSSVQATVYMTGQAQANYAG
ncbi:MAG: hypothetical protein M1361_00970, partial [Patescibacteria group bacterium]|nr:hypothetical protein [Patescibacteria group bacterium]